MNQQEACFIFDWRKSQWNYRLPVLIGISLFGHIFCFYIFRVVYPTTTTLLPPSAQVTVLDPNKPQYKPIYSSLSVELKPADSPGPREQGIPSIFSPETLLPVRSRPMDAVPTRVFPSRLDIASTLQLRVPVSLPALPTTSALSEPTSLFIGVNSAGEVDFIFLRQSSGIGQLDQKAEDFIRTVKFKPEPRRDWGVITLHWGGIQP